MFHSSSASEEMSDWVGMGAAGSMGTASEGPCSAIMQTSYSVGSSRSFNGSMADHAAVHAALTRDAPGGWGNTGWETASIKGSSMWSTLTDLPGRHVEAGLQALFSFEDTPPRGAALKLDDSFDELDGDWEEQSFGQVGKEGASDSGGLPFSRWPAAQGFQASGTGALAKGKGHGAAPAGGGGGGARSRPFCALLSADQLQRWASVAQQATKADRRARRVLFPEALK